MHPPSMISPTQPSRLIGQPDALVVINGRVDENHALDTRITPERAVYRSILSPLRWAISRVADMRSASRDRRMLAELDDRMLQDIGISRAQAQFIASHRELRNRPRD
jgi:uncharacterized protein YjiS (DUF1127 family)